MYDLMLTVNNRDRYIIYLQVSQASSRHDGSNISIFSSHVYSRVGRYQGQRVGIIPVFRSSVNITRDILKDFKEVSRMIAWYKKSR